MAGSRVRSGLAVAAIGVALFATLGEASTSKPSDNAAPNAGATSPPAAKSSDPTDPPSREPIALGTPVEVAKGWTLTVNSANLDADAQLAAVNEFNTPQPGEKFVLVNVTLTNGSDTPASGSMNVDLSILPPSGVAVDSSFSCFVSAPGQLDLMAQMQPGSTATGDVCFGVKVEDIPNSLLLAEPSFTMDKVEDQRFFALQ